jgi:hypothetical protein
MKFKTLSLAAALLAASSVLARAETNIGFGVNIGFPAPGVVVAPETPPPPQYEAVPPSPAPNFVWIPGHWAWRKHWHKWSWRHGHWAASPFAGAAWVPGHWQTTPNGGWYWVEGQWVSQAAYAGAPQAEVVVADTPPPPLVEPVYVAPGPDFFWISGHWTWQGRWVWLGGHFERHPHYHPGGAWINGHWEHRNGGSVWIEGYWR